MKTVLAANTLSAACLPSGFTATAASWVSGIVVTRQSLVLLPPISPQMYYRMDPNSRSTPCMIMAIPLGDRPRAVTQPVLYMVPHKF